MAKVPTPLYRDPVYDGAADPMVIKNEQDGKYYMFYTQRRANQPVCGVSFCYGTAIGVAVSEDGTKWHYRGALALDFEFGHNTFWAPEIVYEPDNGLYHMFVSYIQGIYNEWDGRASIEHYTSADLLYGEHLGKINIDSERIIDPCIFRMPDGVWRMWYKDEKRESHTCYADSHDLENWDFRGLATDDCDQEGPNVFAFGGYYWLIADIWNGLAVYRSDNLTDFVRQKTEILKEPSMRNEDCGCGAHADVLTVGDRAFIFYFTYPDGNAYIKRSSVQMAELKVEDGVLTCDRGADIETDWRLEDKAASDVNNER